MFMFEYVDFLYFDFRGINLSNLRHYRGIKDKSTVQQRQFIVICLPAYLMKQTSLKEPSWMSLYKGLLAYLVYFYLESLGVVRGDHCEIR